MFKLVNKGALSTRPFSPGFIAGDLMFVSGQASVARDDGRIISDTFEAEMRRSIENMRAVLEAAGLSLDNVINCRCYVDSSVDSSRHNEIYAEYFTEPRPTRTTLPVPLQPLLKYEIDCIAYIHATRAEAQTV